jgi:hypothetical protein
VFHQGVDIAISARAGQTLAKNGEDCALESVPDAGTTSVGYTYSW